MRMIFIAAFAGLLATTAFAEDGWRSDCKVTKDSVGVLVPTGCAVKGPTFHQYNAFARGSGYVHYNPHSTKSAYYFYRGMDGGQGASTDASANSGN